MKLAFLMTLLFVTFFFTAAVIKVLFDRWDELGDFRIVLSIVAAFGLSLILVLMEALL